MHIYADILSVFFAESWFSSAAVSTHTMNFVIHVFVYAYGHLQANFMGQDLRHYCCRFKLAQWLIECWQLLPAANTASSFDSLAATWFKPSE